MKLVVCVVDDMDIHALLTALSENDFQATKLASSGGFLRRGNTTLVIGVQDERKEELIQIICKICKPRNQMVPVSPMMTAEESIIPADVMVSMGGATVFVLEVLENYKW